MDSKNNSLANLIFCFMSSQIPKPLLRASLFLLSPFPLSLTLVFSPCLPTASNWAECPSAPEPNPQGSDPNSPPTNCMGNVITYLTGMQRG